MKEQIKNMLGAYLDEAVIMGKMQKTRANISHKTTSTLGSKKFSTMKNHLGDTYTIHKLKSGDDASYHVSDKDGNVKLEVSGQQKDFGGGKPSTFIVKGLYADKDSAVRATDLYHHLITNHNMTLVSDNYQSQGGAKVWDRLTSHPEIGSHVVKELDPKSKPKGEVNSIKLAGSFKAFTNWNVDAKKRFMHSDTSTRLVAYKKRDV